MNQIKSGQSFGTAEIKFIKNFFYIGVCAVLLYLLIAVIVFPSEKEQVSTDCRLLETEWEQILDNGKRIPIEVPGNIKAQKGEVVTIATVLPQNIKNGENLCFKPIWQDVNIYIAGKLRKSYNTKDTRPFGTDSTMRYLFVELTEKDAGSELTYQFVSNSKYAGKMQQVRIGDRASIWFHFIYETGSKTIIAVFLLIMSVICIIICLILNLIYKRVLPLLYLEWAIFFCALWMLSECDFRQILFENVSVISSLTYWSLLLIPFPLVIYINDVQKGYYQKFYIGPLVYDGVVLIVSTILQLCNILQFVQMLPLIHAGLIITMSFLIGTITTDLLKKRLKEYIFIGIGVYGMLFTAILEMILYYMGASVSLGTILGLGLIFLLIMAIVKTGQDLLETEKKKQQAIVAREAQAKFLANMSHEIRTPINAIIGMNEMILRENNNTAVEDYAHNIQSASNMLLGLINDVLDFSKIESGQLELVEGRYSLASLIQDAVLLMKTRAGGKPISTKLDIDTAIPSGLWGDELRIKQILTNLLSNAVKYTETGSVTLKASYRQINEEQIELIFSVIDTGRGIRKENLPQLFDSFKRLEIEKNRAIEGTGLGLNIVRQLVELMNGTITVDSEYGKGSTFTIFIPQRVMDKKPLGSLEASLKESRKQNQVKKALFTAPEAQLLIVDDNAVNLALMKGLLKRTKIQVDTAKSGRECLELSGKKKYDIIFMDHMMPELDGVETLHMLREDKENPNKDGMIIALTANAVAGCREMYLEYGFNDYFSKPIQSDKLEKLLVGYLPEKLVNMERKYDTV